VRPDKDGKWRSDRSPKRGLKIASSHKEPPARRPKPANRGRDPTTMNTTPTNTAPQQERANPAAQQLQSIAPMTPTTSSFIQDRRALCQRPQAKDAIAPRGGFTSEMNDQRLPICARNRAMVTSNTWQGKERPGAVEGTASSTTPELDRPQRRLSVRYGPEGIPRPSSVWFQLGLGGVLAVTDRRGHFWTSPAQAVRGQVAKSRACTAIAARPSWPVPMRGSPNQRPERLMSSAPTTRQVPAGHRESRSTGPSASGNVRATAGRRACRYGFIFRWWTNPHFGVGLCWWLLSGLFARHAEFALAGQVRVSARQGSIRRV